MHGGDTAGFDTSEQNRSAGFKSARIAQVGSVGYLPAAELCVCQIDNCSCQYQERRQDENANLCFRCQRFASSPRRYFPKEAATSEGSPILSGTRSRNCRMRGCELFLISSLVPTARKVPLQCDQRCETHSVVHESRRSQ